MFDWPEQSQTSPIRMSDACAAPALSVKGPPASIAGSATRQPPLSSAVALRRAEPSVTVTCSPGAAVPQIAIGRPRWSTA
jgi:hypothetical protein